MPAHKTTVTRKQRHPKAGAYEVTCPCSWGSYGHDTQQDAQRHGERHEAERNR